MTDEKSKGQVKEALFKLQTKKREVEESMEECMERLRACGCMNDAPLVDAEGFPRDDIDIISVLHDRKQLKELQNDHKAIMKEMEDGLHRLHALDRRHGDFESNTDRGRTVQVDAQAPMQVVDAVTAEPDPRRAFALIDEVSENSPSSDAGLRVGDEVIRCKHVTFETPNALQVLARLVNEAANECEEIDIMIKRGEVVMLVAMRPSLSWGGRGALGCHLVPIH